MLFLASSMRRKCNVVCEVLKCLGWASLKKMLDVTISIIYLIMNDFVN